MLPTYPLALVKGLILAGKCIVTRAAQASAADDFGFGEEQIKKTILASTVHNFYKTMPAEKNPGLMQDVYHRQIGGQMAYVKLQVQDDVVIISFKKK